MGKNVHFSKSGILGVGEKVSCLERCLECPHREVPL